MSNDHHDLPPDDDDTEHPMCKENRFHILSPEAVADELRYMRTTHTFDCGAFQVKLGYHEDNPIAVIVNQVDGGPSVAITTNGIDD